MQRAFVAEAARLRNHSQILTPVVLEQSIGDAGVHLADQIEAPRAKLAADGQRRIAAVNDQRIRQALVTDFYHQLRQILTDDEAVLINITGKDGVPNPDDTNARLIHPA